MSVNLAAKYETKLDERFKAGSFTDKWVGNNYNWDGVETIKIWTLLTDDLVDYTVGSGTARFGTPTEVQDEINVYQLSKKKAFAKTFDEVNIQDTMFVRKSNTYLKQMWDERYIPLIDKSRLQAWADGAGTTAVATLTKSTIVSAMRTAIETLDNADVPSEGRVFFMRPSMVSTLMMSDEFKYQQTWIENGLIKGQVTLFSGIPVVQVPDARFPSGCNFILKYKQATADPMKLRMLRANNDVPGVAGILMEGLCRFDSFVLANKAPGIYAHFKDTVATNVTVAWAAHVATFTVAAGETAYYTDDGSNPKTSSTKKTYDSSNKPTYTASGTKLRIYAAKTGYSNSGIVESVDA